MSNGDNYDGHPMQAGLGGISLVGEVPAFSLVGFIEAVVLERRYVDEDGNRERLSVIYDLRDLHTGGKITNARAIQSIFGIENGGEVVYHPATVVLKTGMFFSEGAKARDIDGDIVLVGFIGGSRERAVILGALPHPSVSYGAKVSDGERRYVQHAGTTIEIKPTGVVEVKRKGTTITVLDDGTVRVVASTIQLGGMDDLSPSARKGDRIEILLSDLVTALTPFFIPTGIPVPPVVSVAGTITTGSSIVAVK